MRKNYFLVLIGIIGIVLFPFNIKATDFNHDEVFNKISSNSTINISALTPLSYVDSNYCSGYQANEEFEETLEDAKNRCVLDIQYTLINSVLNEKLHYNNSLNYIFSLNVLDTNNVKIQICETIANPESTSGDGIDIGECKEKNYSITYLSSLSQSEIKKAEELISSIKDGYSIYDMQFINLVRNHNNWTKILFNESAVVNTFPEIKTDMEKNSEYTYSVLLQAAGAGGSFLTGNNGPILIKKDGNILGISRYIGYYVNKIVFVPTDSFENKTEMYDEAVKRIKKYINDESVSTSITDCKECSEELSGIVGTDKYGEISELNLYKKSFSADTGIAESSIGTIEGVTLNIKEKSYNILLMELPQTEIDKFVSKTASYDKISGVSIETYDETVPLDAVIKVENITDETESLFKDKNNTLLVAYDLKLYSEFSDYYISKIDKGILVKIPIDGIEYKDLKLVYVKEDNTIGESYDPQIVDNDGKKYAVFTLNHFSKYALVDEKEEITNPKTKDEIMNFILLGSISIIGIAGCGLYLNKKI